MRVKAVAAAAVGVGALLIPAAAPAQRGLNVVATARVKVVSVYRSPSASRPFLRLRNPNAEGFPLTFLVKKRSLGWEQVYLPVRPNKSTGWVRVRQVSLNLNPYEVRVDVKRHRVTVSNGESVIADERAGIGPAAQATPSGVYFIVELLKQSNPRGFYGPYAFGLSAYTKVLQAFGGAPGEVGLHGTNVPAALGKDVEHGCIRISNDAIRKLARILPLGTPVVLTS